MRGASSSNLVSDVWGRTQPHRGLTIQTNHVRSWQQLLRKFEGIGSWLNKLGTWNQPVRSPMLVFLLEPEENGPQPIKHWGLHSPMENRQASCQVLVDKSHSSLSTSRISSQAQDRQVAKAPSWPKMSSWASPIPWCHQETQPGLDRTPQRGSAGWVQWGSFRNEALLVPQVDPVRGSLPSSQAQMDLWYTAKHWAFQ